MTVPQESRLFETSYLVHLSPTLGHVWLCDSRDCSTSGFPVLHFLLESAQIHVRWVGDTIQPSHSLSPSSPPALSLSQLQRFFPTVGPLHQVAQVLELQHQSLQWIFRVDFLLDWLFGSPCCPRDSQESSPAPQFKSMNSLALNIIYGQTLTSIHDYWKNHSFNFKDLCWQSNVSAF